ncbi:MAG: prepilin-type cleavage/methylation domain-containing protein [Gammaproteobacteria bacterium]|nr:prepilin-type cleavage/methylation domain-containing protein [Gammaproteobacteria bacterium]MBU1447275.1 prepilin-type cleavage/methylation domain-containing protein [Gammaproteobacteria bacterium]
MKHPLTNSGPAQQGVVIIEAMIAILIFSVGVLGIVGMQANMIKNTSDSNYRSEASYIAQQTIGTMWSDTFPVSNLDNYVGVDDISTLLPGGKRSVNKLDVVTDGTGTIVGGSFRVTVGWTAPGETPAANDTTAPCFMTVAHCFSTTATIAGG